MDNKSENAITACSACMAAMGLDPMLSWVVAGIGFMVVRWAGVYISRRVTTWKPKDGSEQG